MYYRVEIFPQIMDGVVLFEFRCSYARFNSPFLKSFEIFIKNYCGDAFVLVFGMYSYKIKNHILAFLFCFQQMKETEWKQPAICFLHSL